MLGKPAHVDAHRLHRVQAVDPHLREHVHHARREPGVGHHADPLGPGLGIQLLLLQHDLGVAAEVREVHAGLHRELGERAVEVVGNGAHHGVHLAHEAEHGLVVAHVERCGDQAMAGVRCEKRRQMIDLEVGEADLRHLGVLQQVIGAGGTLQTGPENEHSHVWTLLKACVGIPET